MKKNLFIIGLLLVLVLVVGVNLTKAQSPAPETILVCVHQTSGNMEVVASPAACNNKGTLLNLYTQEGNDSRLAALEARVAAAEAENEALSQQVDGLESRLASAEAAVAGMGGQEGRLSALEYLLGHFTRNGNEITISGANLNIVNGQGLTATTNGLGNLVIGYNELSSVLPNNRSGSHMLVVGSENDFSSYGGIVAGFRNYTSGIWASITGGAYNRASGGRSSVSGGELNEASGENSSVSGGLENKASGQFSSVSGGWLRVASDIYDWIAGLLFQDE
jgi:hypothetical protein